MGRGSSSGSSLDSEAFDLLAFNNRHTKRAITTRRMNDRAARPTIANLRWVGVSAVETKKIKMN